MGIDERTLNEMEQEMVSYLLNVDDMNYTMLYEPVFFGNKSKGMSELDSQRTSYLLNVDDMNYTMLCEPLITRYKSAMSPNISNIGGVEKMSLLSGMECHEDSYGSMELIEAQGKTEFPKRGFHPLRPATMEDEIAEDSSYSE
jgi:hypothetical protein